VTPLLSLLLVYSLALIALGAWIGRKVTATSSFFVSDRSLGAGLLFSTLLAANIGASATVGATSLSYRFGPAAWWWSGSAGLGSLVLAFVVGPRVWRIAKEHGLLTVGDFLERHHGSTVRNLAAAIIWICSLFILTGQLIGAGELLAAAGNISRPAGCLMATFVMAAYFTSGGLRSMAPVNLVQLVIKLVGFALAVPFALAAVHGLDAAMAAHPAANQFWRSPSPSAGWTAVFLLGPAFFLSPGLLQKVYAARDESAVRRGVGWNAAGLMMFAVVPVALGLVARSMFPDLERADQALPQLFTHGLPWWLGALASAALFSAEMSAADAVLFMLATAGSRDLYRGVIRPAATDKQVLRVARGLAILAATIAFALTYFNESIIGALSVFYSVLGATFAGPVLGALFLGPSRRAAFWSIVAGVSTVLTSGAAIGFGGTVLGWMTPAFLGLAANGAVYLALWWAAGPASARRDTTP
jgi:SSS family solute:Na+ symporter